MPLGTVGDRCANGTVFTGVLQLQGSEASPVERTLARPPGRKVTIRRGGYLGPLARESMTPTPWQAASSAKVAGQRLESHFGN